MRVTMSEMLKAISSEKTPATCDMLSLEVSLRRSVVNEDRREFFRRSVVSSALGLAATSIGNSSIAAATKVDDERQPTVQLPRGRVPLSFIIDDSTCLVNMGKFCMPQFAATYPERKDYQKPWQQWPDEIPDAFVREFGEWCAEHGVKGKYSIVPYPACVGWLDRTLPGWSQQQLRDSLKLVRDLMLPNWDIHPEMITHTRVIDLKNGRPFADYSPSHMENSYPQQDVSVDYLASYLAYALQILKNCDLPCEGITTPGGFGNRVKDKLPEAVRQSVSDVYGCELPHYFKYVVGQDEDPTPRMEAFRSVDGQKPEFVMNVPAGTGDWFGGWDGVLEPSAEKYCNADATEGAMVEWIKRGQPAVMLCHWPGMYCNGRKTGFRAFQSVVQSIAKRFGSVTQWMKVSEIARYWAAKELTKLSREGGRLVLDAPFACSDFTINVPGGFTSAILKPSESENGLERKNLRIVQSLAALGQNSLFVDSSRRSEEAHSWICIDLPEGRSEIQFK